MTTTAEPPRPGSGDPPPGTIRPGDAGYDDARRAWNLAIDQRPAAVARPEGPDEVARVLRAAAAAGLRVAPQATGHGAGPLGDLADTVLLRTDRMRAVRIDPERRRARAEAGAAWEQVVVPADAAGLSALHGSAPDAGVVGYTLGGGVGWQAGRHGLAFSSVVAIELVTADGDRVRADATTEPDLLWALRGGGGGFGVVTAIEFTLYPLEAAYAGWLIFPWERAREVLGAWAEWTADAPEDVTSVGRLLQLPPLEAIPDPLRGRRLAVVEAAYVGDEDSGRKLMAPLRALGPEMDSFAAVRPAALARLHMDPEEPVPGLGAAALMDGFGCDALDAFLAVAGPGSGSPLLSAEVRHLGGAVGRPAPGAGALSHVDGEYLSFAVGMVTGPEGAAALGVHLDRYAAALSPFGHGARYLSFVDAPTDVASGFDPATFARLRAIRARVDPRGLLRPNHEIPVG